MKSYVVFLLQWMVWSGYTLAEWLSKHDRILYKALIFFVFLQVAFYISHLILQSKMKTSVVTAVSLISYLLFHMTLQQFLPI